MVRIDSYSGNFNYLLCLTSPPSSVSAVLL